MKGEDQVYRLYRTCRDGSLATVVRRRALRPSSPSRLVLSQPKLPSLDCLESAEASQADHRELNFLYPYQTFTSMLGSSKSKLHTRLVSPKTRHSPSPAITLKDRHEDIVERMELSRHNYDLLERRKDRHQALPPLLVKPDFLIQPYSVSPSLSCTSPQVKVKRRQANITEAEEGLKALGFEGDWNKRELLRRLDKSKSISPKRDMQVTRKEVHGKQTDLMRYHEKPRLTKTEVMREEAAQYLQEEFRQQLTSGYLQKLHPANSGMVLLGFRGLELA